MSWRRLLFALLAFGIAWAVSEAVRRLGRAPSHGTVAIEGTFKPGGEYPGEPLSLTPAPRTWGSWAGADENTGTLRLGPFPAPARLRLAISGYPHQRGGNALYLEMEDVGLRWPLPVDEARERWKIEDIEIPYGWRGRRVTLVAVDGSRELSGWLAISEPLPLPGGRVLEHDFASALAAAAMNALLLGCGVVAAARALGRYGWLPPWWIPLTAGAVVALAGYAAFWAYFWHLLAGRIFSAVALAAAVTFATRRDRSTAATPHPSEWPMVLGLTAIIGVGYVALLYLFSAHRDFYDLAAHRFFGPLPGDNRLPHDLAMRLYHGETLKNFTGDWLSSDRPPLQTGWQLLTWPVTALLGFGETTASATSALWLQSVWVAAAYGLLRTLGLGERRALAWCAVLAATGFFLQHTVFTWPKLAAGAFGCGAFAMWILHHPGAQPGRFILGGVFASLAWLSHGGVAFALIALVPFALWQIARGAWREWAFAAAAFGLLALPWTLYQRLYDPPANRLLKWHLAGQTEIDPRGTLQTIRDSYAPMNRSEIVALKAFNLRYQLHGDWTSLVDFSRATARERRQDEFNQTARALGWTLLGVPLLGLALARAGSRQGFRGAVRDHLALTAWTLVTVVTWCVLLFLPTAVIPLGSYTVMLTLFVLLCAWADLIGPAALLLILGLQGLTFATTWAGPNDVIRGPIDPAAAIMLTSSGGALLVVIFRALARDRGVAIPIAASSP